MVLLFSCLLCTATHTDRSWNRHQTQGDQDMSSIRNNLRSKFNSWMQIAANLDVSRQSPSS